MPVPGEQPAEASEQLSPAVGSGTTTWVPVGDAHSSVCAGGQVIVGGVLSTRVSDSVQALVFPLPSTAEQEADEEPGALSESEDASQVGDRVPEQMSLAVALTPVEAVQAPP